MRAQMGLAGKIEVGDTVRTLTFKVAREGVVAHIKNNYAQFEGEEYPGGPKYPTKAHVENLELIRKGEPCHT